MWLKAIDPAFEGVIGFIDAFLVDCICNLDSIHFGELQRLFTRHGTDIGVVADGLGDNVAGALQCVLDGDHLLIEIGFFDDIFEATLGERLLEDMLRQTLQAFLAGDHGARAALGLVGRVQIFEGGQGAGGLNRGIQLLGQLTLFLDGFEDGRAALIDGAQADDLICDDTDLFIIQRAGHFLTITGDERDGVALVEQANGGLHLGSFNMQLGRNGFGVIHGVSNQWDREKILPCLDIIHYYASQY